MTLLSIALYAFGALFLFFSGGVFMLCLVTNPRIQIMERPHISSSEHD